MGQELLNCLTQLSWASSMTPTTASSRLSRLSSQPGSGPRPAEHGVAVSLSSLSSWGQTPVQGLASRAVPDTEPAPSALPLWGIQKTEGLQRENVRRTNSNKGHLEIMQALRLYNGKISFTNRNPFCFLFCSNFFFFWDKVLLCSAGLPLPFECCN